MFTLSFSKEYQKPIEIKDKKTGVMKWGARNDYPFFLIDLLNGSAWHQGIIRSKTFYIAGSGLEVTSGDATLFMQNPYSDYDMNEIVQMLTFDFEVFGAMAAIGTWNREGTRVVRWEFIDIDAVRTSEELVRVREEILKEPRPVVAVDLEWNGAWPGDKNSYVRTVQLSWKSGVACSIVVSKAGGDFVFDGGPDALSSILNSIFYPEDGRHVRVVGHYLTSDLPWLKSIGVDLSSLFIAPEDDHASVYGPNDRFGFEKTRDFGGFDTLLAAHSVNETDYFNLEEQAVRYCGVPRWEGPVLEWRKSHCRAKGIKDSELEGYGDCPDDVIIPYGCYDADVTRRLFDYYNGHGSVKGKLDSDKYGNNCRPAFWLSSRAYPAFIEMHEKGILIDKERVLELTDSYNLLYENLMVKIRAVIHWPDYNIKYIS